MTSYQPTSRAGGGNAGSKALLAMVTECIGQFTAPCSTGCPRIGPAYGQSGCEGAPREAEQGVQGLEPLPAGLCLALEQILDRKGEGDDADNLPTGQAAAANVRKAKEEAEQQAKKDELAKEVRGNMDARGEKREGN